MPFLNDSDYDFIISTDELNAVTKNNPITRQRAEKSAEEMIKLYLMRQYDVDAIFGATGNDRSEVIIRYTIYITLYSLFARNSRQQMSEVRAQQYAEARDFLEAVKDDAITTDLPRLKTPENTDENPIIRGGSSVYPY
jgi:phage gp36-like protein